MSKRKIKEKTKKGLEQRLEAIDAAYSRQRMRLIQAEEEKKLYFTSLQIATVWIREMLRKCPGCKIESISKALFLEERLHPTHCLKISQEEEMLYIELEEIPQKASEDKKQGGFAEELS